MPIRIGEANEARSLVTRADNFDRLVHKDHARIAQTFDFSVEFGGPKGETMGAQGRQISFAASRRLRPVPLQKIKEGGGGILTDHEQSTANAMACNTKAALDLGITAFWELQHEAKPDSFVEGARSLKVAAVHN